ncbi:DUF4830 domain-containing protein [Bacillus sp. MCCB 382]|uniref:DUF4830 domain-containing protein n=1 Tax=Bacillus sp. MCCB 382 TaxID=2860197 RepID=UPI001C5891A0|nr:DUF4830 domain-containing protein [Bacillus sp. MCCB 382]
MNRSTYMIFAMVLLLYGCNPINTSKEDVDEEQIDYISSFDWMVDSKIGEESVTLHHGPEHIEKLKAAGIDFSPYQGKDATITTYQLKEKQTTGDDLELVIYEVDDKIIGGYGVLEGWDPGLFSLNDKERLVKDDIIR